MVYMFLAEGFEEIEALTVLLHKMALRAAEYAERELSGEDGTGE